MPVLLLNGISVPLTAAAGATRETVRIGERSRAFSGRARKFARARKQEWRAQIQPLTPSEAAAWTGLLEGDGHVFSFDADLYSSKGLGLAVGGTVSIGNGSPAPKFGANRLTISSRNSDLDPQLGSTWTVMVWRYESTVWNHYAVCSNGSKYLNGISSPGAVTSWLTVSNGTVALAAGSYDDLVCLPYLAPASWVSTWGTASAAFSALPWLNASGDLTGTMTAMAEVIGSQAISFAHASGWTPAGSLLDLSLFEV